MKKVNSKLEMGKDLTETAYSKFSKNTLQREQMSDKERTLLKFKLGRFLGSPGIRSKIFEILNREA